MIDLSLLGASVLLVLPVHVYTWDVKIRGTSALVLAPQLKSREKSWIIYI